MPTRTISPLDILEITLPSTARHEADVLVSRSGSLTGDGCGRDALYDCSHDGTKGGESGWELSN